MHKIQQILNFEKVKKFQINQIKLTKSLIISHPKMNPWKPGTSLDIQITDIAKGGGDGVCRHENRVIFIPQGVPGDQLQIKLTKIKSKWAHGEIQKITKASKFRKQPKCPIFNKCGGCQYQHITYTKQCQLKQNQV